jgi:NTP pyrophosphatase (non-canonical NTP hydrolase)
MSMQKQSKTIHQMTDEVVKSFNSYVAQGTKKWNWESAAKDLPYQVGSVAKIMQQLTNERWAEGKSESQLKAELSDELADVIACSLFIAAELNIDIDQAWQNMLDTDSRKVSERSI